MGLFDLFKKAGSSSRQPHCRNQSPDTASKDCTYADSSSISPDEMPYYQDDCYYTFLQHPNSPMASRVITFEEREALSIPSTSGLYPGEILLLSYCEKQAYPKPKTGYPGFWWFEYGIRDIGHALESLAARNFLEWAPKTSCLSNLKVDQLKGILDSAGCPTNGKKAELITRIVATIPESQIYIPNYTAKYQLTVLGREELERNGYVPYMHAHTRKTIEDARFGEPFNVWSINRMLRGSDTYNWKSVVGAMENRLFGMDIVNATPTENPLFTAASIKQFVQSQKSFIEEQINTSGDGLSEEMKGIELKKAGRDAEALVQFRIAIGKQLEAPALYHEAAVLLHKYEMYNEEAEVLQAGIVNVPKSNAWHWKELNTRLEKIRMLVMKR